MATDPAAPDDPAAFVPVEHVAGDIERGLLLICDHASNAIPPVYGDLGLPASQLERHIGYDIGCRALTRDLAARLGAPAVLSTFTRLLIDPNRGEDDPTLIMRLSDGAIVPGNAKVDESERMLRLNSYYWPYHNAISSAIDGALAAGIVPTILSIHSFTPIWRGTPRPWHAGILWDTDPRYAVPLIERLRQEPDLVVGDNEPYTGKLKNDTMYRHGSERGIAHALIEVRQDLIADAEGVDRWAGILHRAFEDLRSLPGLGEIEHFGSDTD